MPAIMFQGTGSSVGKSLLVAGLCRALHLRGLSVAPFKPQNMSNNAAVTSDGGEIGRAQALQARAAYLPAHTDMNPVLLKPESETGAQVIVQGRRFATAKAREYSQLKPQLMSYVMDSFRRLESAHDLVLVEGAGSPAEINLRAGDIANMGFAQTAEIPVILIGDIDRGGVIAQIAGTQQVISDQDASLISGFIINKFRGDVSLFDDGYQQIEQITGWQGFGVVPYFASQWKLPAEDGMDIAHKAQDRLSGRTDSARNLHIVCLRLSRIANFDDLDPLIHEPDVRLSMVEAGQPVPADADLVIIPGSKSTIADLTFIREQGWDIDLMAHYRRGGHIIGICGGYQMLGRRITDPQLIESSVSEIDGLGFLDISTEMTADKQLAQVGATHLGSGTQISGYEIHIGRTTGADTARPVMRILSGGAERDDGAISPCGRIWGCYLHGMFSDDSFRHHILAGLGDISFDNAGAPDYEQQIDDTLSELAAHLERSVDIDRLISLAS